MAVKGVIVKIHFGVQCQQAPIARDHKRVNLGERSVCGFKGAIKGGEEIRGLVSKPGVQAQSVGQLSGLKGLETRAGMNRFLQDLLRALGSDDLNLHSAFARSHHHRPSGDAINDQSEIKLASNIQSFLNQHLPHDAPSGPVWCVTRFIPRISPATFTASAGLCASFTPPPLPRPPAWIWAFTTTVPPSFSATVRAFSALSITSPRGTFTP